MNTSPRRGRGRPRVITSSQIAEAGNELFLQQGFHATSIEDISNLAGVSRNTFFNYFASKSDVLWAEFDVLVEKFAEQLSPAAQLEASERPNPDTQFEVDPDPVTSVLSTLAAVFSAHHGGGLPLALSQSGVMQATDELAVSGFQRFRRISEITQQYLTRHLAPAMDRGDILALGRAVAGIFEVKFTRWLSQGPPRPDLLPQLLATAQTVLRGVE